MPSDPRFVGTLRDLVHRIADRAHCTPQDRLEIGQAVEWTTTHAVEMSAGSGGAIAVWFERRGNALEICVRFADVTGTAGAADDSREDEERGRKQLSHLMDDVEFGREEKLIVCRMLRRFR